ncbi:MAG TPA: DUF2939 domain-containing protein [Usitatibacter sp.]|jgi:hypothetical protein|nr:DUF2939 domain-containing protein [Usitatibacter sp.]
MKAGAKTALGVGAVVIVALGAFYVASPWIVLHSMRTAALEGDHRTISDHVDFPPLRENIRGQMTQFMMASMDDPKLKDNPFAGLGTVLARAMVGPMVDAMITPQTLARAISMGALRPAAKGVSVDEPTDQQKRRYERSVKQSYDGLDRFIVSYQDPAAAHGGLALRRDWRGCSRNRAGARPFCDGARSTSRGVECTDHQALPVPDPSAAMG